METPEDRSGSNLYPSKLELSFGPYDLHLDVPEGVWNPTPHGVQLGEVLAEQDFHGEHVLELGTGCGIHAILLAERGARQLSLTEIAQAPLDNARHNLQRHGVSCPIDYHVADWTKVEGGPYDCLVTNPPFTKSGKRYRRYFIDTLVLDTHKLVRPGGRLIFIQSSMADIPRSLRLMRENGMRPRILGESSGPFRPYYFEDERYRAEIAEVPGGYTLVDGVHHERLIVIEGRLGQD